MNDELDSGSAMEYAALTSSVTDPCRRLIAATASVLAWGTLAAACSAVTFGADDAAYREVHIPVDPIELHDATWLNGVLRTHGPDSFITFALPETQFVDGVRLRCSFRDAKTGAVNVNPVSFRAAWKHGDQSFSDSERTKTVSISPPPRTGEPAPTNRVVTPEINDKIDRIRIFPDKNPCAFHLNEITLLLPMAGYQPGKRISLTDSSAVSYLGDGWHDADGDARATEGTAYFAFKLDQPRPLRLRMHASSFGKQSMTIRLNGRDIATRDMHGEGPQLVEVDLTAESLAKHNTLTLLIPDARSPRDIDGSDDDRVLGLAMSWLELVPR